MTPTELLLILISITIFLLLVVLIKVFSTPSQKNLVESLEKSNHEYINRQFIDFTDRFDNRIKDLYTRNTDFERALNQSFTAFQGNIGNFMNGQFLNIQDTMEKRLRAVDEKVNESLNEGFKKTNDTFTSIVERLSKIDEAQKKIDSLSTEIVSLQDILTDKRTRGAFGEVQLSNILNAIFGERNDKIFRLQYSFETGSRADAVLFAPEPLGTVAIDSKFPLENYRKMMETSTSDGERREASKLFVNDCKRHIDAIASKYIIPNVTSDQAIMFVPAEAVFATINAYYPEIIDYSQKHRVWITSPTTLMSTLATIQTILVNMEREKYASVIHDHLKLLAVEFNRYKDRWQSLERRMEGVSEDFRKIAITSDKITRRFEEISNVEISNIETQKEGTLE